MSMMLQLGRSLVVAGVAFAASAAPAHAYWYGGGPYYGGGYHYGYRPIFAPQPYFAPPPVYYTPYWRPPVVYVPRPVYGPPVVYVAPRRRSVARPVHVAAKVVPPCVCALPEASPFAGAGQEGVVAVPGVPPLLAAPLVTAPPPPAASGILPPEAPFFSN